MVEQNQYKSIVLRMKFTFFLTIKKIYIGNFYKYNILIYKLRERSIFKWQKFMAHVASCFKVISSAASKIVFYHLAAVDLTMLFLKVLDNELLR
jgi:hypothetical protein